MSAFAVLSVSNLKNKDLREWWYIKVSGLFYFSNMYLFLSRQMTLNPNLKLTNMIQ